MGELESRAKSRQRSFGHLWLQRNTTKTHEDDTGVVSRIELDDAKALDDAIDRVEDLIVAKGGLVRRLNAISDFQPDHAPLSTLLILPALMILFILFRSRFTTKSRSS